MPQYRYVTTQGGTATVEAGSVAEAIQRAQNRDPSSGVQLLTNQQTAQPTSQSVNQPTTQPNLGSVEQQIQDITKQVQGLTSQVGGFKMPEAPQYTGGIGDAQGSMSFYQSLIAEQQKQAQEYERQRQEAQAKQATERQGILDYIRGIPQRTEDYTQQQYANLGIQPAEYFASQQARIAELDTLSQQYNAKEAEKVQALEKSSQRLAPMSFIRGEQALVERQYNNVLSTMAANINAKTAIMEMEQGNFNQAQNFINQAVSNYTWSLQTELSMLTTFYEENRDIINSLDNKYQNALNQVIALKQDEYNQTYNEKMQVAQLMIDNPQAAITINDTLETAAQKIQQSGGTAAYQLQLAQERRIGAGETETGIQPTEGFANYDVEIDARKFITDLKAQGIEQDKIYELARTQYSQQEASDNALRQLVGLEPILPKTGFRQALSNIGLTIPFTQKQTQTSNLKKVETGAAAGGYINERGEFIAGPQAVDTFMGNLFSF